MDQSNIDRLKALTIELETSASKRKKIIEFMHVSPSACFVKSADTGKYEYVNPAFLLMMGKREDEVLGRTDLDMFSLPVAQDHNSHDLIVLKTGKPVVFTQKYSDNGPLFVVVKFIIQNGNKALGGIALQLPEGFAASLGNPEHSGV